MSNYATAAAISIAIAPEQMRMRLRLHTAKSLLPCALLVTICLQALATLVLRHFQTTFLLQIAHGILCDVR